MLKLPQISHTNSIFFTELIYKAPIPPGVADVLKSETTTIPGSLVRCRDNSSIS